MRHLIPLLTLIFSLQALEFEVQFENSQIRVCRAKIEANEEVGLHRDELPSLVTAIKGGVLIRIEADGSENIAAFPTGITIFRDADPVNIYHRTQNRSNEPIELIIVQLKPSPLYGFEKEKGTKDIHIEIDLNCLPSEELDNYVKASQPDPNLVVEQIDWQTSFIQAMNELIKLVESGKFHQSLWSSKVWDAE